MSWDVVNCYDEWNGGVSNQGRNGKREVVLVSQLKPALRALNPDLPVEAIEGAVEEICRDRTALSLAEANREIDKLLKQGVKVSFPDQEHGGQRVEIVRVIDWEVPENNDFLLSSQFWVAGELYHRRPDLVGFVNGLPLVLIELKKPGVNVREGFDKNLCDYKQTIPQLFHYNALLLVSNGVQSKIGSLTAEWEHFGDWKKATSEDDVAGISLEVLLRGTCGKGRLLDLVENFSRFSDSKGGVSKLLAKNIVHHFLNRGYQGKAMVVSIDKLTTLRMYEKVRTEWEAEKARVLKALDGMSGGHPDHAGLLARLVNLQETDMAVVVSPGQNEISEMKEKGFDILPHRERMVKEDLEEKFKNPDDKFRLVFVCAMWLTGFDAPSCSTLYLDKPMRGHTLMQTIARANRVYGDKVNGLIVDYANVFQELEKALAIYGSGTGGGEMPVKDKKELVEALRIALDQVAEFCRKQNVDLAAIPDSSNKLFIPAVNQLLRTDEVRDSFLGQANDVARLYKAVMPDPVIPLLAPRAQVIAELAKAVRAQKETVNITKDLNEEEQRHLRENISEEELAVFDILTRPGPDLTPVETEAIKKVCKDLLAKLKTEKLVLAWRTKRTTRAAVRMEIEKMLDSGLPEKYTTELFETKCGALFQHVLEKYPESGESVYEAAG